MVSYHNRSYNQSNAMPRRRQTATARVEAWQTEPLFHPYAHCLCDLTDYDGGTPLPAASFVLLLHENGETSSHLPNCPHLRTARSKTSRKSKGPGRSASYPDLEEKGEKLKADIREGNARRQRKETKRSRDAEARAEAMKGAKPPFNSIAPCYCYDALSDSEDEAVREQARTMRHTHTSGITSLHLPNCLTGEFDCLPPHKSYISPPKSAIYNDLEEKEETKKARKKRNYSRRQPKEAKSAAYIDLEGEEEEEKGGDGPASLPAKRYNPRTIASDFLRVIGAHPYLPPLNAHIENFLQK